MMNLNAYERLWLPTPSFQGAQFSEHAQKPCKSSCAPSHCKAMQPHIAQGLAVSLR